MKLDTILISGRTVAQGVTLDAKTSRKYFNAAAYCELNSSDIEKLGASEGTNVEVTTAHGTVVVPLKANDGNPDKLSFIPMGPWANAVLDPDTGGTGTPLFKGVPASIDVTDKQPLDMKALMATYMD